MEKPESLKSILAELDMKRNYDHSLDQLKTKMNQTETLLDDITHTRTVSLKEAILEIQDQIDERKRLHNAMMEMIDQLKLSINNMMPPITGKNPEFGKAMIEFRKKLVEAEEMKIQEMLNCSRDVADLKKELREWIREVKDKENRASLFDEMLTQ